MIRHHSKKLDIQSVLKENIHLTSLKTRRTNILSEVPDMICAKGQDKRIIHANRSLMSRKSNKILQNNNRIKVINSKPIHTKNSKHRNDKQNIDTSNVSQVRFGMLSNNSHVKGLDCSAVLQQKNETKKQRKHHRKMSCNLKRQYDHSQDIQLITEQLSEDKGQYINKYYENLKEKINKLQRNIFTTNTTRRTKNEDPKNRKMGKRFSCQLKRIKNSFLQDQQVRSKLKGWDYEQSDTKQGLQAFNNYIKSQQMHK